MHPAVAVDRELLLATANRHEAELSSEALFGILIAAGELVDPGTLPTAADLDINDVIVGEHTADVPAGVVRAVRRQLQYCRRHRVRRRAVRLRPGGPRARLRRARAHQTAPAGAADR